MRLEFDAAMRSGGEAGRSAAVAAEGHWGGSLPRRRKRGPRSSLAKEGLPSVKGETSFYPRKLKFFVFHILQIHFATASSTRACLSGGNFLENSIRISPAEPIPRSIFSITVIKESS